MVVTLNMAMIESIALRGVPESDEHVLYIKDNNGSLIEINIASAWGRQKLRNLLEHVCENLERAEAKNNHKNNWENFSLSDYVAVTEGAKANAEREQEKL